MPTEHLVRRSWRRIRRRLGGDGDEAVMLQDGLERVSLDGIDEVADPTRTRLEEAFDAEFGDWLRDDAPAAWLKVIVVPPCDDVGIVQAWAKAAGHQLLEPPQRRDLTADWEIRPDGLVGSGLLVIPRLEHWFIRQRNGLRLLDSLLTQLAQLQRHCVVSCNSWAWRFLVKAASADLLLPRPHTFAALDASALQRWFAQHSVDGQGQPVTFRLARTGDDVLAVDDSGAPRSGYLQLLAARSLGIPWVAGHLWRASLSVRSAPDELPERAMRATADDVRTIWVREVDDPQLPSGHEDRSLQALQALLIHGELTAPALEVVMPATGETDVLPALQAAGFLQLDSHRYRVRTTAYPAVRAALQSAGFPLGMM